MAKPTSKQRPAWGFPQKKRRKKGDYILPDPAKVSKWITQLRDRDYAEQAAQDERDSKLAYLRNPAFNQRGGFGE